MPKLTIQAPAKLNLTLDVLRKRDDGYHDLSMIMTSVAFGDTLSITSGTGGDIRSTSNLSFLPNNEKNLAVSAALRLMKETTLNPNGLNIDIDKQIPVCAGMGGGSSDAGAVLRGLNQLFGQPLTLEQLAKIGEDVGSDVPYCVLGGTALAEGKGEILTPLPHLPDCHIVLCKPNFPISTPALFAKIKTQKLRHRPDTDGLIACLHAQDLAGIARRMFNVFEGVLPNHEGYKINDIKQTLLHHGALGACMSGTGPTVFGIFDDLAMAQQAVEDLQPYHKDVILTKPV